MIMRAPPLDEPKPPTTPTPPPRPGIIPAKALAGLAERKPGAPIPLNEAAKGLAIAARRSLTIEEGKKFDTLLDAWMEALAVGRVSATHEQIVDRVYQQMLAESAATAATRASKLYRDDVLGAMVTRRDTTLDPREKGIRTLQIIQAVGMEDDFLTGYQEWYLKKRVTMTTSNIQSFDVDAPIEYVEGILQDFGFMVNRYTPESVALGFPVETVVGTRMRELRAQTTELKLASAEIGNKREMMSEALDDFAMALRSEDFQNEDANNRADRIASEALQAERRLTTEFIRSGLATPQEYLATGVRPVLQRAFSGEFKGTGDINREISGYVQRGGTKGRDAFLARAYYDLKQQTPEIQQYFTPGRIEELMTEATRQGRSFDEMLGLEMKRVTTVTKTEGNLGAFQLRAAEILKGVAPELLPGLDIAGIFKEATDMKVDADNLLKSRIADLEAKRAIGVEAAHQPAANLASFKAQATDLLKGLPPAIQAQFSEAMLNLIFDETVRVAPKTINKTTGQPDVAAASPGIVPNALARFEKQLTESKVGMAQRQLRGLDVTVRPQEGTDEKPFMLRDVLALEGLDPLLMPSAAGGAFSKPLTVAELQSRLGGQVGIQRQRDRTEMAELREGERQKFVSGELNNIMAAEAKRRGLASDFRFGSGEELTDYLTSVGRIARQVEEGYLQIQQQGAAAGLKATLPMIQAQQERQEAERLKQEAEKERVRTHARPPRVRRI